MFGRQVKMKLKVDSALELTRLNKNEVVPILRRQKGFLHEITFISSDGSEAVSNSLWDTRENAEAYGSTAYAEVISALSPLLVARPIVANFQFAGATFARAAAAGSAR